MRAVFTTEALADLEVILSFLGEHYPTISERSKADFALFWRVFQDGRRARRRWPSGQGFASCR